MKTLFDVEPVSQSPKVQAQMRFQNIPIYSIYLEREKYENYEAFQRKKCWPKIMEQALINTILFGGIVPPLITLRKITNQSGTIHSIIDGQQRFNTICRFLDGKFRTVTRSAWSHHEPGPIEPVEPGKSFKQLSLEAQERFKEFTLTIYSSEDMDMLTASFLFRQLNKHINLTKAERLDSYQSQALRFAHELTSHPFWKEVYKGKDDRKQISRGCLYTLMMQAKQGYISIGSTPIGIFASGSRDGDLREETLFGCTTKLGQIMHVFAGCFIQQPYELIPMYQALQFLEKEGRSFDFVASGIFTNWYKSLQQEMLRARYNRTASLFIRMENSNYQEEFWKKHLPTLRSIVNETVL